MSKIFISHSSKDKKFSIKLMELLQTNFSLIRSDFFLSSDEELVVGGNWINQIRDDMKEAKVVLAVITPNYLESQFCLCELGAAWINEQALIPIIVPPLNYHALKDTPYRGWAQAITLNSLEDVSRLGDAIKDKKLNRKQFNMTRFGTRAKDFYEETLIPFIEEMSKIEPVTAAAVKELREQNESLTLAYNEVEEEMKLLKTENDKIREMTAEEIIEYDNEQMDEWDTFMSAVDEAALQLKSLPNLVASVLYYDFKGGQGYTNPEENRDLRVYENEGLIKWDDGWVPRYEHPAIIKAEKALNDLKKIIQDVYETIEDRFVDEYNILLGLDYSPFWKTFLDKKIYDSSR
ncbi:toll/interleukin-1 receptor domain-containing protein [Lysinibacillus fusiformis]|uniref:toll/interleukin-1 receptor domain-containing protein n=1 Tax=Lysinibacillus fusiformis TaxID=28031 RepID=UPI0036EBC270